jgi:hypothetical protein
MMLQAGAHYQGAGGLSARGAQQQLAEAGGWEEQQRKNAVVQTVHGNDYSGIGAPPQLPSGAAARSAVRRGGA